MAPLKETYQIYGSDFKLDISLTALEILTKSKDNVRKGPWLLKTYVSVNGYIYDAFKNSCCL
jgi:hypothetical protein